MGESPVEALRSKPDTSIQGCIEALAAQDVDAVVSAGDTGGVVAASTMFNRRLKGVKRQGIAIPLPSVRGTTLLIDVGANIQCKPVHLLQYAIMATSYAQEVLGIEEPSVGILSVGEEEAKGTDLVKKTRVLLSRSGLNFVGNVEGQSIFAGTADVVVCDGFVGNVILKVAEGLAEAFLQKVLAALGSSGDVADSSKLSMKDLMKVLDYSATGGAPLLGVRGSVIICHGRSRAHAIANAIGVALDFSRSGVNDRIMEGVARTRMLHRMAGRFTSDRG
jgi:glycerol-3-phosphate acyltransferase PlsX